MSIPEIVIHPFHVCLKGQAVVASRSTWEHNLKTISNPKCENLITSKRGTQIYSYMGEKYYIQQDTIKRLVKHINQGADNN